MAETPRQHRDGTLCAMGDFRLDLSFPSPRHLRLAVCGDVDVDSAGVLLRTAATAAHCVSRLELDLGEVSGFTAEGAWALAACRNLSPLISDGVVVRTGGGAGRDLLVASSRAIAS